jgi:hypothetical protein
MGFTISCLEEVFSLPYSKWNNIRGNLIISCLQYTTTKIGKKQPVFLSDLKLIDTTSNELFVSFIELYKKYTSQFEQLGVKGIYLLINKSDCEGSYNQEESTTIIDSVHTISDYYTSDQNDLDELFKVFQKSKENNQVVLIE